MEIGGGIDVWGKKGGGGRRMTRGDRKGVTKERRAQPKRERETWGGAEDGQYGSKLCSGLGLDKRGRQWNRGER